MVRFPPDNSEPVRFARAEKCSGVTVLSQYRRGTASLKLKSNFSISLPLKERKKKEHIRRLLLFSVSE